MTTTRRQIVTGALGTLLVAITASGFAQPETPGWPIRPITLVVPYPAGGTADQMSRAVGQALSQRLGQPVVIDNRPGANGNIGSAYVARLQPADGYTLLFGTAGTLTINPHLYANIGYDVARDLQPVTLTHELANVLVAGVDTPYKTVADVVAAARAKPDTLSYGSAGNGNTMHLTGVLFERQTRTRLVHVPYRGAVQAMTDVMAGQIPLMFNNLPLVIAFKAAGKVRVLAVADDKRSPALPDVPTFAEAGYPGVVSKVWNGILVRRGTPAPIVERLNREIAAILATPAFRLPLEREGYDVFSSSSADFELLIRKDSAAMAQLVKDAEIKLD